MVERLEAEGYHNYEFSNFGEPGAFSQNNTAYWEGKSYIGIGPGAHSYDGKRRAWNVSNNPKYIKAISQDMLPQDVEELTPTDQYNEYVKTRLRTQKGVSLSEVQTLFGDKMHRYLLQQAQPHIEAHFLFQEGDRLYVTKKGKFLSDGIAADLFMLNLSS